MATKKYTMLNWSTVFSTLNLLILLILHLHCVEVNSSGIRLNVPRVLLPYFDTLSVSFTLHVDTPGCYKWTVYKSDIIKLTTNDGGDFEAEGAGCSDSAVISTVPRATFNFPANSVVYVEEVRTKETIRCDVVVDKIAKIKIVTTNSYVHLEEAPSKFHVRGYEAKGNEFSTMEGVPIKWSLDSPSTSTTHTDPRSITRFLPFSESLYEAKPAIATLEANRLQGSEVLVEGLRTGSVIVNARINAALYKAIPMTDVRIVVVANLLLEPNDAYIVPDTTLPLKLLQVKQGRLFEIKLPSDIYVFEVENSTVVSYNPETSTVTGLSYGETKITVRDRSNPEEVNNEGTNALTAYIHVREPKFLGFSISPHENWALMIGQDYAITVDVFDADNQKIYIGNNIIMKTTFESMFFKTTFASSNGSYHVGMGIRPGTSKVTTQINYYVRPDGSYVVPTSSLKTQHEMEIHQRVAINPKLTIFTWDPMMLPKHEILLKASGGNGNFVWSSTNSSFVTVSQSGHARTESYGMANVTAAMTTNTNNKGSARVYALIPTSMKIVDHIVEAEIGAPILVPLAFYAVLPDDTTLTPVSYTTCRNLNFKVDIEDSSFTYDSKTYYPHAKPACAYLPIIGNQLGSTLVTVTYTTLDRVFTDSVTVSTFKPLRVVEPLSGLTTLAVGSSRQLVFEGGPRPLLERVADFSRQLLVANSTVAKVSEAGSGHSKDDIFICQVVCQEIGETIVTLEIGNSRESNDRIPVRRTGDVRVICGEPSKIYFKIETVMKHDEGSSKCPHDISTAQIVRIPVPNYDNILVSVIVKDQKGNRFDNITSLNIDWRASSDIVNFQHRKYIPTERIPINDYFIPGKSLQTIHPVGKSGNIEVIAEIIGYRPEVLKLYNIRPNMRLSKVDPAVEYLYQRSLSMDLQLVADVSLAPVSTSLFNHPSSKTVIKIIEGSGYFDILTSPASIVETKYYENNKTIQVKPLREGDVKIIVKDLCLAGRPTAETSIKVNGVGTIHLEIADKIQVLNSTILHVLLYDKNGHELTSKDLALIKLTPISLTADLIEVEPMESSSKILYKVTGKNVGEATIAFVADGPSRTSRSEVKRIYVFPPLIVHPKQLTLLVGSVYQVISQGGPQPDSFTEFISQVKSKATVTSNGIIEGKALGTSKVNAKAIDQTSSVVYSEDSVDVNVVNLVGVRIHTAVSKISVNLEMPVWAIGISPNGVELDPTALIGGGNSLMTFEWNISNIEIAEIKYPFEKYGLISNVSDQPGFRFRARKPGYVTIRLAINMTGKIFKAETVVEILDELRLINVPMRFSPILMSPNSEISLKTNKESSGMVTYTLQALMSLEGGLSDSDKSIVSIDSTGILRSRDKIGDSVVRVNVVDNHSGITESIGYIIQVRLVAYHMMTPILPLTFLKEQHVTLIPKRISFSVMVTYHDGFGRQFHVTDELIKIRPNRFDVVHFSLGNENHTFYADTTDEGRIGVVLYNHRIPSTKDFLFISVADTVVDLDPPLPVPAIETHMNEDTCSPCAGFQSKETDDESMGSTHGIYLWLGYLWFLVPLTTILTLVSVHYFWKYQQPESKEASEFIFVSRSRSSPRTSTPINSNSLRGFRSPTNEDNGNAMGDMTRPSRRLYSAENNFPVYRFSSESSPSSNSIS